MAHTYTYDNLYRLATATGTYTGTDGKTAGYTLAMGYDNMHRITSKSQHLTQQNLQFNGTLNVGYDLSYTYGTDAGKKFLLQEYDANGNLIYVNTSREKKDGENDEKIGESQCL